MERRKYSREFKHEAVNLVIERGVSVVQASRDLDINHKVLRRWMKEFGAPTQVFLGVGQMKPELLDEGPFFHGTIADLQMDDFLNPGYRSNYRPDVVMNHIYFTAVLDGAGLAAEIAAELSEGRAIPRVYVVEPTGIFENDPNLTDKKFPGNPTRSYRSGAPLKVTGEITHWTRLTPEALLMWKDRLAALLADEHAEIIN